MSKQQSPRRILLAVTGLTPQIVTETLYALACRPEAPWIPHEVHLITTATGANNARLNLLTGAGWFHRLRQDYGLPPITFGVEQIHVLQDAEGQPLDDIRTQNDNTLAADCITDTLRQLTQDPNTELHVSIAGGRKTMGYYLGYALSLYGRPQDRLSHVLVSDPYETNRDFYYPTPYEQPIHSRRGDKEITVDARDAKIDLAAIPFVLLRDGLPERLRTGQACFSRAVETANRGLQPAMLVIDMAQRQIIADDEPIALTQTELLIVLWLAQRTQQGATQTDWSQPELAQEFLTQIVAEHCNPHSADYGRIEEALVERIKYFEKHDELQAITSYFEPHKANINKKIRDALGKRSAERYVIGRGKNNPLPLSPEHIKIISD